MFDIGWSELLVIGVVALIVVGPKDLPRMFRTLGQFTGRARNMAREFQRAMDSAADESGVKDMAKDLKSSIRGEDMGLDTFRDFQKGPKGWIKDKLTDGPDTAPPQDVAGDTADAMVEASRPAPAPAPEAPKQDAGGSYVPAAARRKPPAPPAPESAEPAQPTPEEARQPAKGTGDKA